MNDKSENKVNLSIGLLTDQNGKTILHQSVIKAEQNIINQYNTQGQKYDKIYPEEGGSQGFLQTAQRILLGETTDKLISVATPSCGSIALAYQICKQLGSKTLHLPQPGWQMHSILNQTIQLKEKEFQYIKDNKVDIDSIVKYIQTEVQPLDIFMIQFSCNNPTGLDYNAEQLKLVFDELNKANAIGLVDVAYQGIATGSIIKEQERIKQCFECNQLILCQFFDKNFTIYAEGCSAMHMYIKDINQHQKELLHDKLKLLISSMFGLAPVHGQQIVQEIWNNDELRSLYQEELHNIVQYVNETRVLLQQELNKQNMNINISNQIGIYACFDVTLDQVVQMAQKYHIYMLDNGRINLCGITKQNVQYFVQSLKSVIQ